MTIQTDIAKSMVEKYTKQLEYAISIEKKEDMIRISALLISLQDDLIQLLEIELDDNNNHKD